MKKNTRAECNGLFNTGKCTLTRNEVEECGLNPDCMGKEKVHKCIYRKGCTLRLKSTGLRKKAKY